MVPATQPGDWASAIIRPILLLISAIVLSSAGIAEETESEAPAIDNRGYKIVFTKDDEQRTETVRVLVKTGDDYHLIQMRDGRQHLVTPANLVSIEPTGEDFAPYTFEEMEAALRKEFDPRAQFLVTKHYVIVSAATPEFTEWSGKMFERLYHTYFDYWNSEQLPLHEPEFPLVAVILPDFATFNRYAAEELDLSLGEGVVGFYSPTTNRMVMSDLASGLRGGRARASGQLNALLNASMNSVSTVVHEATHQIANNCGMHTRYADTPTWLSEGIALYCDSPDLKSGSGWGTIGKVNTPRLRRLKSMMSSRAMPDIKNIILIDDNMKSDEYARKGYAYAWALTYYLMRYRKLEFLNYVNFISQKRPLFMTTPKGRLADFETAFGDINELEQEFLAYYRKLR
ncbi:DUF1570 domain-containing protein [Calycomorphotria hydatis]|uniref:DUF1570 domain-containing protein n=1 Tax=Calycomorphotria hydatis TaxID=2528027 RepID=UPI0018D248CC|nr:DUF1570 domain-containing protein [Calycomorphotria hydatis]